MSVGRIDAAMTMPMMKSRIKAAIPGKMYIGVTSQSFWVVPIAFARLRDDRDIRDSRKG